MNKTFMANNQTVQHNWYVVDAAGLTLGRLSTVVASLLRGKHKPQFTPNVDTGDFVIIINAEKICVTGKKETDKMYYHHTGYPGGLKSASFKELMQKDATMALEKAIKGMLPHNTLGQEQFNKLKIYAGAEHPHAAQKPVAYTEMEAK